jgi:sulfur relay (sulfurtransferase) DsrF/TusC family protein
MLIIIKSNPFATENAFGALFIALSAANSGERTEVIFVEKGLLGLFTSELESPSLKIPNIPDIIQQLVGTVFFFFVLPGIESIWVDPKMFEKYKVSGLKSINYCQLCDKILENGKNLIVL